MRVKTVSCLAAGVLLAAAAGTSQAQVAISIGTPGFYGAIDIGDAPPPALVYQQPVAIQPLAPGVAPLYLYVPPEQYANWGAYCDYYDACDRPVYFVDGGWYQRVYVPHYRSHRHFYVRRQAEFARHAYRPSGRVHPGGNYYRPPAPPEHRPAPPVVHPGGNYYRPPAPPEHRPAPPAVRPGGNYRPPAAPEHRPAPPAARPDNNHRPPSVAPSSPPPRIREEHRGAPGEHRGHSRGDERDRR